MIPNEALAELLPSRGHVGVPCETCRASVGYPCQAPDWRSTHPHAARKRRANVIRAWLFLHGIDANEAGR